MTIAIEAERANIENPTGVEHYAQQLILALAEMDQQNKYILYLRTKPAEWMLGLPKNFSYRVLPFPIFWTQLRLSWEILFHSPDALIILASALPFIHPKNSTVTIHDLAWEYYPETFTPFMRTYLRFSTWFACLFAKKIIAVSNQTKQDLVRKYRLSENRVTVIYHGFSVEHERFGRTADPDPSDAQKLSNLPQKYVLYLGTLQPRKNVLGLIDAFVALKQTHEIPHQLVLAGGMGWLYQTIIEKIKQYPYISYIGYVNNRFLFLNGASILVQPAFYEGFGLQILDAFACSVPVACSNISSLPEVAGDAAEYFDPKNMQSIETALAAVLLNDSRSKQLIQNGLNRLPLFTWKACAERTLSLILQP